MNWLPPHLQRRSGLLLAGAAFLLAIPWLFLAFHGATAKSPAFDEVAHFGDGLAVLRYGDHRMNPEHPPLFKVLSVLPVEVFAPRTMHLGDEQFELAPWVEGHQWRWGYYLLFLEEQGAERLLVPLMRIVPILTGLLGGLVAFLWGREFGGRLAGIIAAFFLLYYPEYLGHARFLTLDVPVLVACGLLGLAGWHWWRRPGWGRVLLFVAAGAVLPLVKLPVGLFLAFLLVVMGLLLVYTLWRREPLAGERARGLALAVALLIPATFLAQWAAAGFQFDLYGDVDPPAHPHHFVQFDEPPGGAAARLLAFVHRHRILPEATIAVLNHSRSFGGRPMFLLGEERTGGWLHYFAVTTALKTPLVYLVALAAALVLWAGAMRRGVSPVMRDRMILFGVPLGLLALVFVLGRANLGHRYILFVYLPWSVLVGWAMARWWRRGGGRERQTAAVLCGLAVLPALKSHPDQETWFNTIAGGSPWEARTMLRDSNIDWGQDLPALGRALEELGNPPVNLAYFGAARFEAYINSPALLVLPSCPNMPEEPPSVQPNPEWHSAISLNCLPALRRTYPGRFDREPIAVLNSIALFAPETASP